MLPARRDDCRADHAPRCGTELRRICRRRCYGAKWRWLGTLIKQSFSLADRRTSVALEQEFWVALKHIAASRQQTLTTLVATVDAQRPDGRPLASTLRVLALQEFFPQVSTPASPSDR
jgi:predicted DNA-binding ribbon-helix-helix protein